MQEAPPLPGLRSELRRGKPSPLLHSMEERGSDGHASGGSVKMRPRDGLNLFHRGARQGGVATARHRTWPGYFIVKQGSEVWSPGFSRSGRQWNSTVKYFPAVSLTTLRRLKPGLHTPDLKLALTFSSASIYRGARVLFVGSPYTSSNGRKGLSLGDLSNSD
jgi:hypothetical protein